jgi:hypothetical protein
MDLTGWLRRVRAAGRVRGVKGFDHELRAAGGLAARADAGARAVPVAEIVGSVGRWRELRPDFTFRDRPGLTERHRRVGEAMRTGRSLPLLELYSLRTADRCEYFVVDGHHRVAMARRLGQAFLDAHVVEHRVAGHPS